MHPTQGNLSFPKTFPALSLLFMIFVSLTFTLQPFGSEKLLVSLSGPLSVSLTNAKSSA